MKYIDNWFSNFKPFDKPLIYQDISYSTPEHFFQAMKSTDLEYRKKVSLCQTPGAAKRLGRKAQLRYDWEDIKLAVMEDALRYKFKEGTTWHKKLMETEESIVEWNNWHDNFWGDCICEMCKNITGQNHLGRLLMKIRNKE